ncbi:ABC transporter permease [Leucobacter chromiiresistens]|uniref:ABC transporter permease n=1 Tax=Leucobacter chromiiresistens TaxID=1079994 RepID=A0A147EN79_9MICO|nr:ABC transporter permease [Leucobacter chromiiresistens]KTR85906.1 ABC transporter permease [Leucobacter chromiiresistens]
MTTYSLPLVRRKRAASVRPPRDGLFIASIATLAAIVGIAVVAAVVPFAGDPAKIVGPRLSAPSGAALLGTDALGRSVLARLLEGIGTTLVLSAVAVLCTAVISVMLGMIAGYLGGWTREGVMRFVDVLYSFPSIVLAILIAAVVGPGQVAALASIVLVTVPLMTRMVSAASMAVAKRDFVTTAQISGVSAPVILFRHVLPNISGTIAVQGTYALSVGILVEGGLSFLGYGVQLPQSSLGLLIQEGSSYMVQAPWLLFAPAVVLVLAILAINLVGDTLRDRLDPRETRSLV